MSRNKETAIVWPKRLLLGSFQMPVAKVTVFKTSKYLKKSLFCFEKQG